MVFAKRQSLLRLINVAIIIVIIAVISSSISIILNVVIQERENYVFETRNLIDIYSDEISKTNILRTTASLEVQTYNFDKESSKARGLYNQEKNIKRLKTYLYRIIGPLEDRLLLIQNSEVIFKPKDLINKKELTVGDDYGVMFWGIKDAIDKNIIPPSFKGNYHDFLEDALETSTSLLFRMANYYLKEYVISLKTSLDEDYKLLKQINTFSKMFILCAFGLQIIIFLIIQLFELREEDEIDD